MSRFTYANVMATVAFFLALGGGAMAATNLGKNTVGAKQLKKNAVNGAKVKDQSLTGKDINLAKLGIVPAATNAANATTAGTASALTPPEAVHLVGAPGQPPFQNGASNPPGGAVNFPPASFYKDHDGIVHLEGVVKPGEGPFPGVLFTLPPGFRPASGILVPLIAAGANTVFIAGSGVSLEGNNVEGDVITTEPKKPVSLSGITFRPGG